MTHPSPQRRCVLVCQHRSCERAGSVAVLAAFKAEAPAGVFVSGSQCLGLCGAGPNVQIVPDTIWYCRITPEHVPAIVQQHLLDNRPVQTLLHPRMHAYHPVPTELPAADRPATESD